MRVRRRHKEGYIDFSSTKWAFFTTVPSWLSLVSCASIYVTAGVKGTHGTHGTSMTHREKGWDSMAKSRNFLSLFWANAQEGKGHLENEVSLFMLSRFCLLWSALAEQASSVGGSRRQHDIIMEERKRRKLSLSRQVGSVPYSITGPYIRSVVCCRQS